MLTNKQLELIDRGNYKSAEELMDLLDGLEKEPKLLSPEDPFTGTLLYSEND